MTAEISNKPLVSSDIKTNIFFRGFAITYALFAYCIGAGVLFWFFFAAVGIAPYSLSSIETGNIFEALIINTFLVFLFALQHTIMARRSFKQKWTQIIPEHLERATFVLLAGIFMALIMWCWQSLPGVVWLIESMNMPDWHYLVLLFLA